MSTYGYSYGDVARTSNRRTIRRVNVGSAMKIGAMLQFLIWAVFGLIFLVVGGLCSAFMTAAMSDRLNPGGSSVLAGGLLTMLAFYFVGLIASGVLGAITGALYAGLYNLSAGWIGGLEVEVY